MGTQPNSIETTGQVDPNTGQPIVGGEGTENVTPEPSAGEKLLAGKYKSPEELEQGYISSNREATRMAQEISRLTTELQQARTPKQVAEVKEEISDITKHFEPETAKILKAWGENLVNTAIQNYSQTSTQENEFRTQVTEIWEETKKVYPDVTKPNSELYKRADQILFERKLAFMDNGILRLITPFAYRIAVEAAAEELSRQAPAQAATQTKKNQATFVPGRGSHGLPSGKLTYAQYSELSDEEKDAYDQSTLGKK